MADVGFPHKSTDRIDETTIDETTNTVEDRMKAFSVVAFFVATTVAVVSTGALLHFGATDNEPNPHHTISLHP